MENQVIYNLIQKVARLEDEVRVLKSRRITQTDLMNSCVKSRHVSEGVNYIRSGLAAARPTTGEEPLQGSPIFFATDSNVLSVWNGSAWVTETLT
jgi:hypothetical protein